jgi:hypothetical protein
MSVHKVHTEVIWPIYFNIIKKHSPSFSKSGFIQKSGDLKKKNKKSVRNVSLKNKNIIPLLTYIIPKSGS